MNKKTKKVLVIILAITAILLLNKVGGSFIKKSFYVITSPIHRLSFSVGDKIGNWVSGVFLAGYLKEQNIELEKQNILLKKKISGLNEYKKEAEILKQVLSIKEEASLNVIPTDVLLFQTETDSILITTGKNNGAVVGMPVITPQGALVGVVDTVDNNFSSVFLISSSNLTFDVQIYASSTTDILAVVSGLGNKKVFFGLVPQKHIINQGDIVKTTSLGGKFPKNILVGEVNSVRKNDAESFQEGTIKPYFTNTPLNKLFLITNFNQLENE